MKIKKNDTVKMLTGKDREKTGKVLRVFSDERKITVENLNMIKKHKRPRREGEKGQRVEIPRRVDISNVALVCPKCNKITRIGYRISGETKTRFCKKCKAEI
ncbi:MAG TPA: 50S ribosomal protein L24 [Patescibacteria group bacterium]|nr:50S ribosomal protein L24 [Patescibacteria group bacterium]